MTITTPWLRVGALVCSALLLSACNEKKSDAPEKPVAPVPAAPAPAASTPAAAVDKPSVPLELPVDGKIADYLPGLDELYTNAKGAGISAEWIGLVSTEDKNFEAMTDPQEKAFAVGRTLSDVGYITLHNPDGKIDPTSAKRAYDALKSISPPEDLLQGAQTLSAGVESGSLSGVELSRAVDTYVRNSIPRLQSDPAHADLATAAMFSGFLRATYVGSTGLSQSQKPVTAEHYSLLDQPQLPRYFIDYFTNKAADDWKSDPSIQRAVQAAIELEKILNGPPLDKAQVQSISALLAPIVG